MNENFNFDTSNSLMSKFRLVIKNIPKTLPDSHVKDILSKNFGSNIFDVVISKSLHKSKNNKICYVSVDSIERRKEIINFFSTFELVDPKGFKQKLNVVDCLYQEDYTNKLDPIENTIDQMEHFIKFKEYYANEKLVDFKLEESKFSDKIFDGVPEKPKSTPPPSQDKKQSTLAQQPDREKKPGVGKMIITKKNLQGVPSQIPSVSHSQVNEVNRTKTDFPQTETIVTVERDTRNFNYKGGYNNYNYDKNNYDKNYYDNNYYEGNYSNSYYDNRGYDNNGGYNNYSNNKYGNNNYGKKGNYRKSGYK